MSPAVRVVLLNWNDREQAERCADAVLASRGVEPDILVVDNGSSGDDVPRLRKRLGDGRVLALPDNLGYAGGMNAGLAFWREERGVAPVLILTPDAIVEPGTLRHLVDALDADAGAGVVGPLVVHSRAGHGMVSAGGAIDVRRVRARPYQSARAAGPFDVDWIDGCCMLVRPEIVGALSFDERFFIYFEETDFCCRARRAGWRVLVAPEAVVEHPKSPGTLPPYYFYYMVRNRYLFWQKNFQVGPARVGAVVAWLTLRGCAAAARSVVARRDDARARLRDARLQLRAAWTGTGDHLRGRYGRMPASRMPRAGS